MFNNTKASSIVFKENNQCLGLDKSKRTPIKTKCENSLSQKWILENNKLRNVETNQCLKGPNNNVSQPWFQIFSRPVYRDQKLKMGDCDSAAPVQFDKKKLKMQNKCATQGYYLGNRNFALKLDNCKDNHNVHLIYNNKQQMLDMYKTDRDNVSVGQFVDTSHHSFLLKDKITQLEKDLRTEYASKKNDLNDKMYNFDFQNKRLSTINRGTEKQQAFVNEQRAIHHNKSNKHTELEWNLETAKRQVEIADAVYTRKNQKIEMLRLTVLLVILGLLGSVMTMLKFLDFGLYKYMLLTIVLVWLVIMITLHLRHRDEDPLNRRILQFRKAAEDANKRKQGMNSKMQSQIAKNLKCFEDRMNNSDESKMQLVRDFIDLLKMKKRAAIKNEDFLTARDCTKKIDDLQYQLNLGHSLGGYKSKEEVEQAMEEVTSMDMQNKEKQRFERQQLIDELQDIISQSQEEIRKKNALLKKDEENDIRLMEEIRQLQNGIKSSQAEIDNLVKLTNKLY